MEKVLGNPLFTNFSSYTSNITGEPVSVFKLKNLDCRAFHSSNVILLRNSLIKFRFNNTIPILQHSPEYFSNLTYSGLVFVTDYLSSVFNVEKSEMIVSSMEFSITTETPLTPSKYFYNYNSYLQKPFYFLEPPKGFTEPLEKYCSLSQYKIKEYDYGQWNEIEGRNLLRFEIPFLKMQKVKELTGRNKISLSDFNDKRFLRDIGNFAMKTHRSIEKKHSFNCGDLKPKELELFFAGQANEYWQELKKHHPDTAKKKRVEYAQLQKQFAGMDGNPLTELEERLQAKFEALLES